MRISSTARRFLAAEAKPQPKAAEKPPAAPAEKPQAAAVAPTASAAAAAPTVAEPEMLGDQAGSSPDLGISPSNYCFLVGADWNMNGFCFHILGMSSSQLTNSY